MMKKNGFGVLVALMCMMSGLVGCGSKSSTTTTTTASYYLSNGLCYDSSTGANVALTYCGSSTGYYYSNGYCYSSATNAIVDTSYCSSTSTTGIISKVCYGYFYWVTAYGSQLGYCNGSNCSGYTLYAYGTNQQTYCQ